jgi:hypothetical protein
MSSHESLDVRLTELTHQLDQKDTELDQEVNEIVEADLDALDRNIEATKKGLRDDLRQRVEAAKKAPKDRARKEAEQTLNRMEEDLSKEDLVSAHVDRWIANQWLKVSK